jgi:23S rRNA pseudouridine955/2504/2580 synthase
MSENVEISMHDDGQRLDRWLKKNYPELSFGDMQKILRTGQIRVDGKRVKGDSRLKAGQMVRVPPMLRIDALKEKKAEAVNVRETKYAKSMIVYQDDHIIVLNKPAGLATQGGSKVKIHVDKIIAGLARGGHKPHLVHRLDKETSGLLLLARTPQVARALGDLFKGRDIRKYYWALTLGVPEMPQGKVKSTIAKVEGRGGERMMVVDADHPDGKNALTFYNVIDQVGDNLAWVAFWPRTGRTHQIRVHALQMGTPLLGDHKYAPDQEFLTEKKLPNRLYLHAERLIFPHPATGRIMDIRAPMDEDMRKAFREFGLDLASVGDPFEDVE